VSIRVLFSVFVLLSFSHAKDISPSFSLHTKGVINDFVIDGNKLYVATSNGTVDIFDLKTKKLVHQIALPALLFGSGKMVRASISSVDVFKGKVLLVSNTGHNYRNVWQYENYELEQIVDEKQKLIIKEARFIDEEHVIFATIDGDIILYETGEKYQVYNKHIANSTLGDIALSKDKKKLVSVDESGALKIFDTSSGSQAKKIKAKNLDKVFHVAHSNGVSITGGQDRRVAVYSELQESYYLKSSFLVYCVGLSPSGDIGVYSDGEENILQTFDTYTGKKKDRLIGHKRIISQIRFVNEKMLFSSDQGYDIFFWEL